MRPPARKLLFTILSTLLIGFILVYLLSEANDLRIKLKHEPGIIAYALNDSINRCNEEYAKSNPFGFTDRVRNNVKPKGVFRIGVLGDSFVWGSGLPYDMAWSHKLEKKMLAEYDSVEVMHWGKSGWSTLDEFNFYREHGRCFNADMVIIGWVDNDPDLGIYLQHGEMDPEKEYPMVSKIMPALARRWVNQTERIEYSNWMDSLYSKRNLAAYQLLLDTIHAYFNAEGTKAIFILTPGDFGQETRNHFAAVKPLITSAGFNYLDIEIMASKNLGRYNQDQLHANPVNGHPGPIMTEEFADETLDFLKSNNYLKSLPIKAKGFTQ